MKKVFFSMLLAFLCIFSVNAQLQFNTYTPIVSGSSYSGSSSGTSYYRGSSGLKFNSFTPVVSSPLNTNTYKGHSVSSIISGGNYSAIVAYSNSATGYKANYELVVKVSHGNIEAIYFGNNGYIHRNGIGYSYQGGELRISEDEDGDIYAYGTVVTSDSDGVKKYTVFIQ